MTAQYAALQRPSPARRPRGSFSRRVSQNLHAATGFEAVIRFADWARAKRREPTIAEITDYMGCCRASAYRYRSALRAADGEGSA